MVGYAMAALPPQSEVPWHRVINRLGMVSDRKDVHGSLLQRDMLESEGIRFDKKGRVDLSKYGWVGPSAIDI